MPERPAPEECANCGAAIPRGARACPECGADERTGWRDTSVYDALDLPDEAFDHEKPHRERPVIPHRVNGIAWYWWVVAVVMVALIAFGYLRIL